MDLKEVSCPYCGHTQDEEVGDDSHICEGCGEIFCSVEDD